MAEAMYTSGDPTFQKYNLFASQLYPEVGDLAKQYELGLAREMKAIEETDWKSTLSMVEEFVEKKDPLVELGSDI